MLGYWERQLPVPPVYHIFPTRGIRGIRKVKRKLFFIATMLALLLLLVYPLSKELMQQKTENFYFETYTVQPNDTLWSIAREHNTSGKDIRELIYNIRQVNKLDSVIIKPGQELLIPKTKEDGINE